MPKRSEDERTLTVIGAPASHPDEIDRMSFDDRRTRSDGWTVLPLLFDGAPDVVVLRGLDLDLGVYSAPGEWDSEDNCAVQTSLIVRAGVRDAQTLIQPFIAGPLATAKRLIAEAGSREDPAHVASTLEQKLTKQPTAPARGPAEEAAAFLGLLSFHVNYAVQDLVGVAWELRTPAPCDCARAADVRRDDPEIPQSVWALSGPPYNYPTKCKRCGARFSLGSMR